MESLEARAERYLQEAERVRVAAGTEDTENRTVLLDVARQYAAATMIEELRRYR
jgi:hypothetical protein